MLPSFQQVYLELQAAERLQSARDFAARRRQLLGLNPARSAAARRWPLLVLAAIGLAFILFLV